MPICEAFAQIEQQPNIYDVVHVKYFDEILQFLNFVELTADYYMMVLPLNP
ncbi:UPF0183 domain-containing protein [Sesbania bispinosa]|nr:UPF0183 domain-containing protein [Sesbania bispinosa]